LLLGLQDGGCVVRYIDYGNSELVTKESLQEMHLKHCVLPEQAVCCTLISAQPPEGGWNKEVRLLHGDVILFYCF